MMFRLQIYNFLVYNLSFLCLGSVKLALDVNRIIHDNKCVTEKKGLKFTAWVCPDNLLRPGLFLKGCNPPSRSICISPCNLVHV